MTSLTLPLLVFDSQGVDLSAYDSVEAACGDLEAIDVRSNEFASFDSDGYPVELMTSGYAVVGARRIENARPSRSELATRLRVYLLAVGDPAGTAAERSDLSQLIGAAVRWSR